MSKPAKKIPLKPLRDTPSESEPIMARIVELFQKEVYSPLLHEAKPRDSKISGRNLIEALHTGRIYYDQGQFKGQFSAIISKELQQQGARWDGKHGSFTIPLSKLPVETRIAIQDAYLRFQEIARRVGKKIESLSASEIAEKLNIETLFDKTLWKVNDEFKKTVEGITVAPKLTPDQMKRLTTEYTHNMKIKVEGLLDGEIKDLRAYIQESVYKGLRPDHIAKALQKSYGLGASRAKSLARNETSLFLTKFKQIRYQDAGVNEYIWRCVAGSPNHPVRPMHQKNDGKVFTWDNPPVVDDQGNRKNPGQDYNCRCTAIPLVKV